MDQPSRNLFVISFESDDKEAVVKTLETKGHVLPLHGSLYLIDTEASNAEILLAFNPLKKPSFNGLFIMKTENIIWQSFGPTKDGIIQEFFNRFR
jgi:hypothetical protein